MLRSKGGRLHGNKLIDGYRSMIWVFSLLVAFFAWATPSRAQTGTGALRVLVQDTSGALVPGASVDVTDVATNSKQSQKSNTRGYAVFSSMERGTYNVQVAQPGYGVIKIAAVTIDVNQIRDVTAVLKVADTATTVEVQASPVALQTEDASQGAVVTAHEIVNLPLAERRYTDLVLLAPGATTSTDSANARGTDWFVVNGTRSTMNNYLLDGMDNNNGTHNDQSRSAEIIAPPPDGLAEFQVLTDNPSALYGRAAGAVVIASTKSGTNNFHGAAWEFNRITALAANSWLSNHDKAGKDQLTWNQPGGAIGGPILKNKLFYFGDYEYLTSTAYSSLLGTVPVVSTPAGLGGNVNGDYSNLKIPLHDPNTGAVIAGNVFANDPNLAISSVGQKVMQLYPAPNLPGTFNSAGQPANNYGRSVPLTNTLHKEDFRLDYYPGGRNKFFGRYNFNQDDTYQTTLFPNPLADSGQQFGGAEYARNQSGAGGWTFIVSPTKVNDFRFQYINTGATFTQASYGLESGTKFGFLGLPSSLDTVGSLPIMSISGYNALGDGNYRPQFSNPWSVEFNDNFSLAKGAHTLQFGFDYRLKQDNLVDLSYRVVGTTFTGGFTGVGINSGDATADLLLGYSSSASAETFTFVHQRQQIPAVYIQDDWKVRKNFSVNLGMRYEYYTPEYGIGQYPNINFNFITGQLEAGPGAPMTIGNGSGVAVVPAANRYTQQPDRAGFGPKLGLSYQINDKLVARAGFGFYYDGEDIAGTTPLLTINPPNVYNTTLQRVGTGTNTAAPTPWNISQPLNPNILDTKTIASTTLAVNAFYPYAQVGRIEQWNAALQYLVSPSSTFTLGYVGNSSHGMRLAFDANDADYGVDGSVQANRPYPLVNGIDTESYLGASRYNSLQAAFEKRSNHGLSTLLAYTFASAIDDTDDFGSTGSIGPEVVNHPANALPYPVIDGPYGMWGPDTEVPRQTLKDSTVWVLPFGRGQRFGAHLSRGLDYLVGGWSASGIFTRQTGLPFGISLSSSGTVNGVSYSSYTNTGGNSSSNRDVNRPDCDVSEITAGHRKTPDTPGGSWLNPDAFSLPALTSSNKIAAPGVCPRNPVRGPGFVNWDQSLLKRIPITEDKSVELHFDFFNLLNHPNFATPSGTSFGASGFGNITTTVNNPRQIQMAVKFLF